MYRQSLVLCVIYIEYSSLFASCHAEHFHGSYIITALTIANFLQADLTGQPGPSTLGEAVPTKENEDIMRTLLMHEED